MPRKSGTAQMQEFDVRITPTDQQPITKAQIVESDLNIAEILIVCQEGEPNGVPVLHYHLYVKAKISETKMASICSKLGRATADIKGNSVFSVRKAHQGTIGYVVKNKNVIHHNQDQTLIDQYFKLSEDYNKAKAKERKSAFRKNEKTLAEIMSEVEVDCNSTAERVVTDTLKIYHKLGLKFPTRSALEVAVMSALYPHQPSEVNAFYCRNLYSWR